jgi:hypothetical protein
LIPSKHIKYKMPVLNWYSLLPRYEIIFLFLVALNLCYGLQNFTSFYINVEVGKKEPNVVKALLPKQ